MEMNSRVELKHFWRSGSVGHENVDGTDNSKLFLTDLAENIALNKKIVIQSHFLSKSKYTRIADFLIAGFNPNPYRTYGHDEKLEKEEGRFYVWYTSENKRPPLYLEYDIFLSHDLDSLGGRNFYLPFWATKLAPTIASASKKMLELTTARKL